MHARALTHAHTDQYLTLIAFRQQHWLRERLSVLRYTHIACLGKIPLLRFSFISSQILPKGLHAYDPTKHCKHNDY
jgi:hypothetical protein